MRARVALFGGTFDPVHRGHVTIAQAAADRFALDEVLFAPAGRQPLKRDASVAAFADRLAMIALACVADRRFRASELDGPRGDGRPNYTADTLRRLRALSPASEVYCIAGADSFQTLGKWREAGALLELAEWIVVSRPGYSLGLPEGITVPAGRVHLLDAVAEDVSATELRRRLQAGEPCEDVLPDGVAAYIRQRGLYAEDYHREKENNALY